MSVAQRADGAPGVTARTEARLISLGQQLESKSLHQDLLQLAAPLADRLGLPRDVDEIGVVCADVEKTARDLESQYPGMGPFFLGEGAAAEFTEDGTSRLFRTRLGFGYYRNLLIELAEPGVGSDLFRDVFDPSMVTIHHLGFYARGKTLQRCAPDGRRHYGERFLGAGYLPHVRALVSALGVNGNIVIFNTAAVTAGVDIEFIDVRLFGRAGLPISLPRWALRIAAWFQIRFGPRVFRL